jgi:hypothetical protein
MRFPSPLAFPAYRPPSVVALGVIGKLQMYPHGGDTLRLTADIERLGLTVGENCHGRLVLRPYRPSTTMMMRRRSAGLPLALAPEFATSIAR